MVTLDAIIAWAPSWKAGITGRPVHSRSNTQSQRVNHRVYEKIALHLERFIFAGRLKRGDRLLSERELAEHYGASRVVIREALRRLQGKGLLEVRQGAAHSVHCLSASLPSRES